jgi:hypothetical protein
MGRCKTIGNQGTCQEESLLIGPPPKAEGRPREAAFAVNIKPVHSPSLLSALRPRGYGLPRLNR